MNYVRRYGGELNRNRLHCPFVMHVLFVCNVQLRELMIPSEGKKREFQSGREKKKY